VKRLTINATVLTIFVLLTAFMLFVLFVDKGSGEPVSPWPMFRGNAQHTGLSPYNTNDNPGEMKWEFRGEHAVYSSSIVGSDGIIYVGTTYKYFYAINPDGTVRWKFDTMRKGVSSIAMDSNSTIYIATKNIAVESNNSEGNCLVAINSDGSEKWRFYTDACSPIVCYNSTVYIGANDHYLYAVNNNGTLKWKFQTEIILSSPAIGCDGTIYFASSDNYLSAVYPNGTLKWKLKEEDVVTCPTIGSDGTIYIGLNNHSLIAVDYNGTKKWEFDFGNGIPSNPAIGLDGTIYTGSSITITSGDRTTYDGHLYAIYSNGTEKWKIETNGHVRAAPVIGYDGTIYFGSYYYDYRGRNFYGGVDVETISKLCALNPDGTSKWESKTTLCIDPYLAIGADGTIYVSLNNGCLYAMGHGTLGEFGGEWYRGTPRFPFLPDSGGVFLITTICFSVVILSRRNRRR